MRVLLSTYGSRGDVEPLAGLAVQVRALGAEVRVCAPPDEDFAQRLAGVGVTLVPVGQSARADDQGAAAVGGGPAPARGRVGRQPVRRGHRGGRGMRCVGVDRRDAGRGRRSIGAEKLRIRSVSVTFQHLTLPSPHQLLLDRS
jgi:vancomycin aglycone glucosyltransferase